jgi:excisionase family DNA binding protein
MDDPTGYMTTQEAAKRLGITDSTVRAQIGKGKLSATMFGPIWLIAITEVERYARENQPTRRGGRARGSRRVSSASKRRPSNV